MAEKLKASAPWSYMQWSGDGNYYDVLDREGGIVCEVISHEEYAIAIASLPALIEAAEPILKNLNFDEAHHQELYEETLGDNEPVLVPAGRLRALREALSSIKGGK